MKLVDSLLAKDPNKRPPSPHAVAETLAKFAKGNDLQRLVADAQAQDRRKAETAVENKSAGKVQGQRRRNVPLSVAIAAGLLGILVGFVCGITITIRKPDGSQISMTVPEGSDIDIRSVGSDERAAGRAERSSDAKAEVREQLDELGLSGSVDERLSGIWRVVQTELEGREVPMPTQVMGFRRNEFYATTRGNANRLHYSVDREHSKITLFYKVVGDFAVAKQPRMDGTYEFLDDGKLVMRVREVDWQTAEGRGRNQIITLERLRDFPSNQEEVQAFLDVKDSELARAMVRLFQAAEVDGADSGLAGQLAKSAEREKQTRDQLKQIGIAFHDFHDAYGKLPASASKQEGSTGVAQGKEIHPFSWRVAILPSVARVAALPPIPNRDLAEQALDLFEQYRFDEPWDSEHNLALIPKMPEIYRSPRAEVRAPDDPFGPEPKPGHTHYQGFVGERSALGATEGKAFAAFRDGTSNSLLIVESQRSVPWTKPQDLPFENPEDAKQAQPFPGQPLTFLMADGSVQTMDPVDWEKLAKMITIAGRESLERSGRVITPAR